MLRVKPEDKRVLSFDEATERLRARINYQGPRISDKDIHEAIDKMFCEDPQWAPHL